MKALQPFPFDYDDPLVLLPQPVMGVLEVSDRYPARVRFSGTSWEFMLLSPEPQTPLVHNATVRILGIKGLQLLITA